MATPLYLGIDLGTTNSTAAAFDGEQLTLIRNAQRANLTPSVVRLDARHSVRQRAGPHDARGPGRRALRRL